jgi:hypothetical protein
MPIIVGIVVVALIVAALVSLGRVLFSGGGGSSSNDSTDSILTSVLDTADNRAVQWTVRGPIVADENFKSYQITVSPTKRVYTTYNGYLDQVVDQKTFTNNTRAYDEFVHALDKASVAQSRNVDDSDYRGVCATNGFVYVFETLQSDTANHTLWTSSCKGSKGNMSANTAQVHALFTNQIPGFKPVFTTIY